MNTLLKSIAVAGMIASGSALAAPVTVGGITWDPDAPSNFLAQYNFTQWYTSSANAIGSGANLAPNFNAALTVPGQLVSGNSVLNGTGEIYNINGTGPSVFAAGGGELTIVFGGLKVANAATSTFDFSNAFFNFYSDPTADYPFPADAASQSDVNNAADGILWLSAKVSSLVLNGNLTAGFVSATLEVTGGAAAGYFVNGPLTYDIEYAGSSFFSPNAKYSSGGNGQFKSNAIPEPATVALLGLGLLGMGRKFRRKA